MFYTTDTNAAHWAFLVFVVAIAVFGFFYVFLVNKRRFRQGVTPLRGTSWMMPPTYNQAQESQALPVYTANPNPNQDIGFYDAQGNFHANPYQSKSSNPQTGSSETTVQMDDLTYTHNNNRNTTNTDSPFSVPDYEESGVAFPTQVYQTHHFDEDFPNFYAGRQQGQGQGQSDTYQTGSNSNSHEEEGIPNYTPPSGPPPLKTKK